MDAEHWLVGPQLIGLIMLVAGLATTCFPPKHINPWYGYRTFSSMVNEQTWNTANCYSSKLMTRLGAVLILSGLLINWLVSLTGWDEKVRSAIFVALILTASIGSAVVIIVYTERHLKRTFNNS